MTELEEMLDSKAQITFLPVCSKCKQILWVYIDYEELKEIDDGGLKKFKEHRIVPMRCPYCKRIFDMIAVHGIPFDNHVRL